VDPGGATFRAGRRGIPRGIRQNDEEDDGTDRVAVREEDEDGESGERTTGKRE